MKFDREEHTISALLYAKFPLVLEGERAPRNSQKVAFFGHPALCTMTEVASYNFTLCFHSRQRGH